MKQFNPKRGKPSATINFTLLTLVIIGLSVHFTRNSLWGAGTVVIIVLLSFVAAFYFWLWRTYFK
jgi:type IV secretory pathway VirB2 component (pilin)